jgi:hypothetical protein
MRDRVIEYLRENLRDPGTMRSLAWAGVGLALASKSEEAVAHYASLAVFVLGMVSAAIPPRKP